MGRIHRASERRLLQHIVNRANIRIFPVMRQRRRRDHRRRMNSFLENRLVCIGLRSTSAVSLVPASRHGKRCPRTLRSRRNANSAHAGCGSDVAGPAQTGCARSDVNATEPQRLCATRCPVVRCAARWPSPPRAAELPHDSPGKTPFPQQVGARSGPSFGFDLERVPVIQAWAELTVFSAPPWHPAAPRGKMNPTRHEDFHCHADPLAPLPERYRAGR